MELESLQSQVNPNNAEAKQLLQQDSSEQLDALCSVFHLTDVEAKKESKGTQRERNVYAKMLQTDWGILGVLFGRLGYS